MRTTTRNPVALLGAIAMLMWSSLALAAQLSLQTGSKLWLEGKSTMHAYESTASAVTVEFQQDEARWPADAKGADAIQRLIRAKGVTSMEVVVPVTGLHSGKVGLDKNMYKALRAPSHPAIRFRMESYEVADGKAAGEMAIAANGTLNVAGVDQKIQLPVTAVREDEALRMRGSIPLLMTQFGIKPPVMMMGALKTSDQVVIHFDLLVGVKDTATTSKVE